MAEWKDSGHVLNVAGRNGHVSGIRCLLKPFRDTHPYRNVFRAAVTLNETESRQQPQSLPLSSLVEHEYDSESSSDESGPETVDGGTIDRTPNLKLRIGSKTPQDGDFQEVGGNLNMPQSSIILIIGTP